MFPHGTPLKDFLGKTDLDSQMLPDDGDIFFEAEPVNRDLFWLDEINGHDVYQAQDGDSRFFF